MSIKTENQLQIQITNLLSGYTNQYRFTLDLQQLLQDIKDSKEHYLATPVADGYILASTTGNTRYWLPTSGFSPTLSFNNGLILTGNTVQLGGSLIQNTVISGNSSIQLNTNNIQLGGSQSTAVGKERLEVFGNVISAGLEWTSRVAAVDNSWKSVTYGNGLFVAVSDSGTGNRVMTSPDGINWTIRTSANNYNWNSITYGNGLFVAVSTNLVNNNIMTSPDGINWTLRTTPLGQYYSITYGNGLFVATTGDGSGLFIISQDGINWISIGIPTANYLYSVTYGNGIFVSVSPDTGNQVMTSPDGINWTIRTSAANNSWRSVTYGNGLFVVVSFDSTGQDVMTSPDGINWTLRNTPADQWISVTYGNGLFVAISYSNNIMTSPDSINWKLRTNPITTNNTYSITYGNGVFVSVAFYGIGNRVVTSGKQNINLNPDPNFSTLAKTVGSGTQIPIITYDFKGRIISSTTLLISTGITLTYSSVTSALGFTPYNATNPNNYISGNTVLSSTYNNILVDSKGLVISGTNIQYLTSFTQTLQNSVFSGDLFGSGTTAVTLTLNSITSGQTVGSSTQIPVITYDNKGRIVSSTTVSISSGSTQNNITGITSINTITVANQFLTTGNTGLDFQIISSGSTHQFNIPTANSGVTRGLLSGSDWSRFNSTLVNYQFNNGIINSGSTVSVDSTTVPYFPSGLTGTPTNLKSLKGDGTWGTLPQLAANAVTLPTAILTGYTYNNGISGIGATMISISNGALLPQDGVTLLVGNSLLVADCLSSLHRGLYIVTQVGDVSNPWILTRHSMMSESYQFENCYVYVMRGSYGSKSIFGGNRNGVPGGTPFIVGTNGMQFIRIASPSQINSGSNGLVQAALSPFGNTVQLGGSLIQDTIINGNSSLGLNVNNVQIGGNQVTLSGRTRLEVFGDIASVGLEWTSRTGVTTNSWYSITYGNGLFVAVSYSGTGNRVMTSPDGINWTSRVSAANNAWQSVTYGNGLFVAVSQDGTGNRVMTSPDGINWTSRVSATDNNWRSVCYGNGLFVAVSQNGVGNDVMTSPDGINWTLRTSIINFYGWDSVCYGNGLFVAVGQDGSGNDVMTSPNGINWTSRTTLFGSYWNSVTYGNGLFVAVGYNPTAFGYSVMTSPDGINWITRTVPNNNWESVTYGNGLFVAVSQGVIMTSHDGINWTLRTVPNNNSNSLCYGNGLFVAVAATGTILNVMTSGKQNINLTPDPNFSTLGTTVGSSSQIPVITYDFKGRIISSTTVSISSGSTGSNISGITSINNLTQGSQFLTTGNTGQDFQIISSGSTHQFNIPTASSGTTRGLLSGSDWTVFNNKQSTLGFSPLSGNTVLSGTYNNLLIDSKGLVISGTNIQYLTSFTQTLQNSVFTGDLFGSGTTAVTLTLNSITSGQTVGSSSQIPVITYDNKGRILSSTTVSISTGITLTYSSVTSALGYVPYNSTNPNNYISGYTFNNGLTLSGNTVQLGGSLIQNTVINGNSSLGLNVNNVQIGGNQVTLSGRTRLEVFGDIASVGLEWTIRTGVTTNSWNSVCYGNGLFVAVGYNPTASGNRVMTSPDGINWTSRVSAADYSWVSVCYGNGLFVAVSDSGIGNRVMTSPDGINWTLRTSVFNSYGWYSVCYGNGLFVAVGQDGSGNDVMTSPNGINWTSRTTLFGSYWNSVTYGNGLFVAVSDSGIGNRVMTSPDGINWTLRTSATDNGWNSVTYGNGLFVAVSYTGTGNRVMTSPDGINWTLRTSAANNSWVSVCYGNGLFVAVSYDGVGNGVMTSPDGINWTSRVSASDNQWYSVCYGNGLFVIVAVTATILNVMTSGKQNINLTPDPNFSTLGTTVGSSSQIPVITYDNKGRIISSTTVSISTGSTGSNISGITSINNLTQGAQFLTTGSTGLDFQIISSGSTHQFNIPTANSGVTRGLLSGSDWTVFNNKQSALGFSPLSGNTVLSGTYNNLLIDSKGLVISGTNVQYLTSFSQTLQSSVFTGDLFGSGTTAVTLTLNSITSGQTVGSSTQIPIITYDNKGRIISSTTVSISTGITLTYSSVTSALGYVPYNSTNPNNYISGYTFNNGLTLSGNTVQLGGSLIQDTVINGNSSLGLNVNNVQIGGSQVTLSGRTRLEVFGDIASVGLEWTIRVSAVDNSWYSITYGNGLFVAVSYSGTGNRVMTSPDGINWTSRVSATDNNWKSVTYGNGLFVAVSYTGTGNRVMTSPDGINWTSRVSATDNNWRSVCYGNGLFVAVSSTGTGNRVMTSPDGINWTSRVSATDNNWESVTYGNGLFVAVGYTGTGNRVMTSPDGINWTSRVSAVDNAWNSVTYGNGLFVAVSYTGTGNRVMTSPDGINWTLRTSAADNGWLSVCYGNGLFVAVSYTGTGNRVMTSPDGINWALRISAADNGWNSVYYGNGLFVAVSYTGIGNRVMTSGKQNINLTPDPNFSTIGTTVGSSSQIPVITYDFKGRIISSTTVSISSGSTGSNISGITSINNLTQSSQFLTTGNTGQDFQIISSGSTHQFNIPTANSGVTRGLLSGSDWTVFNNKQSALGFSPLSGNTVLSGTYNNLLIDSKGLVISGTNVQYLTSFSQTLQSSVFTGDLFGSGTTAVTLTLNSITSGQTVGSSTQIPIITYDNKGRIISSTTVSISTGITLTYSSVTSALGYVPYNSTNPNNYISGYTFNNGLTLSGNTVQLGGSLIQDTVINGNSSLGLNVNNVQIGGSQVTLSGRTRLEVFGDIASVGLEWTIRTGVTNNNWKSVTYGNGLFVAVSYSGTGNRVMTSPDGINWTSRVSAANNAWRSVCYGNGLFVAVSSDGVGNEVMTSPDGITWTSRVSASDNTWQSVTYGNGLFVAVGQGGSGNDVMTSPDGINWTLRVSVGIFIWALITYGNGLFVAVGQDAGGNDVMTSPDGINWTSRATPFGLYWNSVTYGNGLFVAVGYNPTASGNRVMTSPDGINWTSRTSPTNNSWLSVCYGNGLFVAVQFDNASYVMTSPDGINWVLRAIPFTNQSYSVCYGNGLFVALAQSTTFLNVMTSGKQNINLTPDPNFSTLGKTVGSSSQIPVITYDFKGRIVSSTTSTIINTLGSSSQVSSTAIYPGDNYLNVKRIINISSNLNLDITGGTLGSNFDLFLLPISASTITWGPNIIAGASSFTINAPNEWIINFKHNGIKYIFNQSNYIPI